MYGYQTNFNPVGSFLDAYRAVHGIMRDNDEREERRLDREERRKLQNAQLEIQKAQADREKTRFDNEQEAARLQGKAALYQQGLASPEDVADLERRTGVDKFKEYKDFGGLVPPRDVALRAAIERDGDRFTPTPQNPALANLRQEAGLPPSSGEPWEGAYRYAQEQTGQGDAYGPAYERDKFLLNNAFQKVTARQYDKLSPEEGDVVAREFVNNPAFDEHNPMRQHRTLEMVRDGLMEQASKIKGRTVLDEQTSPQILRAVNVAFPMFGQGSNLREARADKIYIEASPDGDPAKAKIIVGIKGKDDQGKEVEGVLTENRTSQHDDPVYMSTAGEFYDMAERKIKTLEGVLALRTSLGDKDAAKKLEDAQLRKIYANTFDMVARDMAPEDEGYKQVSTAATMLKMGVGEPDKIITEIGKIVPKETFQSKLKLAQYNLGIDRIKAYEKHQYDIDLEGIKAGHAMAREKVRVQVDNDREDRRTSRQDAREDRRAAQKNIEDLAKEIRNLRKTAQYVPQDAEALAELEATYKQKIEAKGETRDPLGMKGKPTAKEAATAKSTEAGKAVAASLKKDLGLDKPQAPKTAAVPKKVAEKPAPKKEDSAALKDYKKNFNRNSDEYRERQKQDEVADAKKRHKETLARDPNQKIVAYKKRKDGQIEKTDGVRIKDTEVGPDGKLYIK